MLHQDETDKPLIAIWIPEAMEWSKLGSNTEEEEESIWTHRHTQSTCVRKTLKETHSIISVDL